MLPSFITPRLLLTCSTAVVLINPLTSIVHHPRYMREGALIIEIRGSEDANYAENATNFNHLANMFLVHYRSLVAQSLKGMKDKEYALSEEEMKELVGFVEQFLGVNRETGK